MNRYKIALGYTETEVKGMDIDLETRLRNGAAAWMLQNRPLSATEKDSLEKRSEKALFLAMRLFPSIHSEDCIKTAADFMHLDDDKLDKIIDLIKSGK